VGFGQETDPKVSEVRPSPVETVTAEGIDAALKEVVDSTELDEPTKARLKELYVQARAELEKAVMEQKAATKFSAWVMSAAKDIEDAKRQKDLPLQPYDVAATENLDLNSLIKDRAALEQQLTDAKTLLLAAQDEPQRRVNQKAEIPMSLTAARTALQEVEEQLKAVASSNDPQIVLQARVTLLRARRQASFAGIASLESERDAYEAQGELPRLRIDSATTRVKQIEQDVGQLLEIITERRTIDAAAQKEDAKNAFQAAPLPLKPYAQQNVDLSNRRLDLANEIQVAAASRQKIGKKLARWQEDFARTKIRADTVNSSSLGLMLIERRSSLPSVSLLQRNMGEGQGKLNEFQIELYELEDRRADLSDVNAALTTALAELRSKGTQLSVGAEGTLKVLFTQEVQILNSLLKDANRNYSLHIASMEDQQKLVRVVREYGVFIETRVLWVRSAEPLQPADISHAGEALAWLAHAGTWQSLRDSLVTRVRYHLIRSLLLGFSIVLLFLFRRRIRKKLEDLGRIASTNSCRTIWPTMQAFLLTTLLVAPWPLLAHYIGWGFAGASSEQARAISSALFTTALWLLMIQSVKQVWRPSGLADAHFGWPAHAAILLAGKLQILFFVGTPLVFFGSVFQLHGDPIYLASLGRVCLVALLLLLAGTFYRLFRTKIGVVAETTEQSPNGLLNRFHRVWHHVIGIVPAALAVLAISGFQYTAYRLTFDLLYTFALVFLLCLVGAILFRWVRVKRRRLRWQQLVEARQRDADESETSDLDALAVEEEKVDLVAMDLQTRRLSGGLLVGIGLIGLSAIWFEVLPALTSMLDTRLWEVDGVGGGVKRITIGAVLLASLIFVIAILASRNIPGLVDVMLLGRLGIESSTRYAISTLSQYAIVTAGVLVACSALGLTWSKVQWLVAALGVGLGFGLQEVVANFVCGIVLLFERPIRVGDVVTVGDSTGVVIRIRSRATTVRNWDRQEVVIPNKELITGRIVNWTLSDQLIRITVQVGIAYGSDTNRARELLYQIVKENPNVLDDPQSLVTFEKFGDSTLNFNVRAFLANIDERLETIHELNTSINQRFADEGIEIAFPQRDLHVRSVDKSVKIGDSDPERTWGSSPDEIGS
jgi:potassium efflux system protein